MLCNNQGQPSTTAYSPSDLLTTKETAGYLKQSEATLRNQRHLKKGPAFVRVGMRAVRYRFEDIEKYVAASTAKAVI